MADRLSISGTPNPYQTTVYKPEETCLGSWYRVAVGSVQSLQRPSRLARFEEDHFGRWGKH